ncbi:flagellar basal body-associated protein FliL [Helicobacter sp. 12S02232-10]|uniref:flagellar basal body-associated protein FliL n=1 Tax=Helicobacter sp. 12S02232-10 TaxID=1476197 RepID=UPI000BA78B1C|nr:flagellar basal body-associated protein FliL [Helicobacter sp. 12S02232-10]PAF48936.1 flagellar basal body-associated protein FliL [Helicobacter sp. 12S02232-10]
MAEEKENTEQQTQKKSKTLLFIIIGVVILMIIIGGIVAMAMLSGGNEDSQEQSPQSTPAPQNIQKKSLSSTSRQSDYMNIGPLYAIPQPFIVNLVTQSGRRYLKASITLELSNQKLQNEINAKATIIQDTIIEILSSKSIEEIATTKGKDRLKDEIASRINDFLIDGYIKNVFFTDFVIQ